MAHNTTLEEKPQQDRLNMSHIVDYLNDSLKLKSFGPSLHLLYENTCLKFEISMLSLYNKLLLPEKKRYLLIIVP